MTKPLGPLPKTGVQFPTVPLPRPMRVSALRAKFKEIESAPDVPEDADGDALVYDWHVKEDADGEHIETDVRQMSDMEAIMGPEVSELMYLYDTTYRRAVSYVLWEHGYTQSEIAEHMMVSQGTVSQSILAVRRKIAARTDSIRKDGEA